MQPLVSETLLSPHQWGVGPLPATLPGGAPPPPSSGTSSGGSLLVPKLRQPALSRDATLVGQEGAPLLQQQQLRQRAAPALQAAWLWLDSLQQHCQLLPFFDGPLLALVLLQDDVVLSTENLSPIIQVRVLRQYVY